MTMEISVKMVLTTPSSNQTIYVPIFFAARPKTSLPLTQLQHHQGRSICNDDSRGEIEKENTNFHLQLMHKPCTRILQPSALPFPKIFSKKHPLIVCNYKTGKLI